MQRKNLLLKVPLLRFTDAFVSYELGTLRFDGSGCERTDTAQDVHGNFSADCRLFLKSPYRSNGT